MKKTLLAIHLFNDYSGSPKVLADSLSALQEKGWRCRLVTSASEGFLSYLPHVTTSVINYEFQTKRWRRLLWFCFAQCQLMLKVWKERDHFEYLYINTLLPAGAALMGKLLGKKVIYHLHETTINPWVLKKALRLTAKYCANQAIYVSQFLAEEENLDGIPAHIIHNALSKKFINKALSYHTQNKGRTSSTPFTCLMACSLKSYKGIEQYLQLAELLPAYRFELVLNASHHQVNDFFASQELPDNLIIFPVQKDMHWFYQRADLVLNLSLPDQWVETFGMTLLEALQYGKPVIGPTVGGPKEVIQHRRNGFCLNAYYPETIANHIQQLVTKPSVYEQFSNQALLSARKFSHEERKEKLHLCFIQSEHNNKTRALLKKIFFPSNDSTTEYLLAVQEAECF